MASIGQSGTFTLGGRAVKRLGYGAMQLAGPGVFGPPKDRDAALAVLREAVASGVDHIDTSDFYGPHVTNQIIRAPNILLIPGTSSVAHLRENLAAPALILSEDDLAKWHRIPMIAAPMSS